MELSPGQRKLAFAVIVLALAGLGAFLLIPGVRKAAGVGVGKGAPTAGAVAPTPRLTPLPSPSASPTPSAAAVSSVDIYRLLPFSQTDLDQASAATQRFAVAYGSYSYQQNAASYTAPMRGLASPQLVAVIARGFATPGVADARVRQQQVATAAASVTALRAFGSSSLTFVVKIVQSIAAKAGKSVLSTQYAVTLTRTGGGWQVADIQLASAGNA